MHPGLLQDQQGTSDQARRNILQSRLAESGSVELQLQSKSRCYVAAKLQARTFSTSRVLNQ